MRTMMMVAALGAAALAFSACADGSLCRAERSVKHQAQVCPPTFDAQAGEWVDQSLTPTGCTHDDYDTAHGGGGD